MKRRNILHPMMAAALTLSSLVPSLVLNTSNALADDYNNGVNSRYDCIRNPNSDYCNSNRDWRNQDQNRDWRHEDNRFDRWRNNRRYDLRLSSGTSISTRASRQGRIVLRRGERYAYQLITDRDLFSERGNRVVIPRGSTIDGYLMPYRDGYRFEARSITLRNGGRQDISAVSDVIDSRDQYGRFGNDAVLSPGASGILEVILGRRITSRDGNWGNILDRDSRARRDLVVIYPNRDLDLKLNRDFVLSYR